MNRQHWTFGKITTGGRINVIKLSNVIVKPCHSEERSDEESSHFRWCEDPSLALRMTQIRQPFLN